MSDTDRFKEMVHYVCHRCDDTRKMGAIKLNKILWYADTYAYRLYGRTISGETAYTKRQHGPVPKRIVATLKDLEQEGFIKIREGRQFGNLKRDFICLKDADESVFTPEEIDIIKDVAKIICEEHTATSISDLSHDDIWNAAHMGEDIPVYAVLGAGKGEITQEHVDWARDVFRKHDLARI